MATEDDISKNQPTQAESGMDVITREDTPDRAWIKLTIQRVQFGIEPHENVISLKTQGERMKGKQPLISPQEQSAGFDDFIVSLASSVAASVSYTSGPPPLPSLLDLVKERFDLRVEPDAPQWVKRAADLAFDSLVPPRRKQKASEAYNIGFDSGYAQGAWDLLPPTPPKQDFQLIAGIHGCGMFLKQHWAKQPIEEAADFLCGFRDGERLMRRMPERAQQMAQRTKIYCAIAARWKEIAPSVLHSTGQLHQWLLSQKIIVPGTDSAEIRLVCAKIGLRYKKPGKPPKS
jgi:hypothetical protein